MNKFLGYILAIGTIGLIWNVASACMCSGGFFEPRLEYVTRNAPGIYFSALLIFVAVYLITVYGIIKLYKLHKLQGDKTNPYYSIVFVTLLGVILLSDIHFFGEISSITLFIVGVLFVYCFLQEYIFAAISLRKEKKTEIIRFVVLGIIHFFLVALIATIDMVDRYWSSIFLITYTVYTYGFIIYSARISKSYNYRVTSIIFLIAWTTSVILPLIFGLISSF